MAQALSAMMSPHHYDSDVIKGHRSNHSASGTQRELLRGQGCLQSKEGLGRWKRGEELSKERTNCSWRMEAPGCTRVTRAQSQEEGGLTGHMQDAS